MGSTGTHRPFQVYKQVENVIVRLVTSSFTWMGLPS